MAGRCAGCARTEASPKTIASAERAIDTGLQDLLARLRRPVALIGDASQGLTAKGIPPIFSPSQDSPAEQSADRVGSRRRKGRCFRGMPGQLYLDSLDEALLGLDNVAALLADQPNFAQCPPAALPCGHNLVTRNGDDALQLRKVRAFGLLTRAWLPVPSR